VRSRGLSVAVVGLLVVAGLTAATGAAAKPRRHVAPRVRAVIAPSAANPGGTVELMAHLSATTRTDVTFWLSRTGRLGRGTVRLASVRPRGVGAATSAAIPSRTAVGRYRVLACLGARCAGSGPVGITTSPASSEALIQAAVAAHRLSAGTALLYRLYALKLDLRLPARYRGQLAPFDDSVMRDVMDAWPRLSRSLKARLAPFLLPPAYRPHKHAPDGTPSASASSYYKNDICAHNPVDDDSARMQVEREFWGFKPQLRPFRTFVSPDGHVRFWYEAGVPYTGETAHALASQVGRIWKTYSSIMGRTPLSDEGAGCFWGGDGRYDVYVTHSDQQGTVGSAETVTYPPKCSASPAWTVIEGKADPWILAHEMFHAFQDAFATKYRCGTYNWIAEGSADWAAHVVYPDNHREYGDARFGSIISGTHFAPPELNPIKGGAYMTWPLWLFLAQGAGNGVIGSIWAHAGGADAVHAVDEAVPGGWRKQWREFTRAAYNADPWKPFQQWDGWPEQPDVKKQAVGLAGAQKKQIDVHVESNPNSFDEYDSLPWLQRAYTELDLGDDVQSIDLTNPRPGNPDWGYQAYLHFADGHWQYRDLSATKDLNLCRQDESENVDKIVLMMSNSAVEPNGSDFSQPLPKLIARTDCNHYYKVTAFTGSLAYQAHYPLNRYSGDTCSVTGSEHYTVSSRDSGQATDGSTSDQFGLIIAPDHIDGGAVDYSDPCNVPSSTDDPCHSDLPPDDSSILVGISHDPGAAEATVQIGTFGRDLNGDIYCHDRFGDGWVSNDDQNINVKVPWSQLTGTDPITISGSDSPSDTYRSVSRHVSITLQPVDIDGSPLAPPK
jgi:hypothetical protein